MNGPLPVTSPLSGFFWEWIVPAVLYTITLVSTWLLYRHFSRKGGDR